MRLSRFTAIIVTLCLCASLMPSAPLFAAELFSIQKNFAQPIDAFSIRLPQSSVSFRYQYSVSGRWSSWQGYESDGDVGSGEESELIMVPKGTISLRVEGLDSVSSIHEITVSKDPVKVRVASTVSVGSPGILSRREWGADETYLFDAPHDADTASSESDTSKGDNGIVTAAPGQPDQRVKDCDDAVRKYPDEFKTVSTVRKDAAGRTYRWPLQYSAKVKLLVVHHSALIVKGDPRPAAERVRALYKYHAVSKGWGDIGYNFVVDEDGVVYEGRTGGEGVIGGHAYCNNVGTIGIVLMGNFELESPSQEQAKGLQKLLSDLASRYDIDLSRSVTFHGKTYASPIVGHKDLLSTLCPGYSLYSALSQIIANVRAGNLLASVSFPPPRASSSSSSSAPARVQTAVTGLAEGFSFTGRTSIAINPGGKQRLSFAYTASEAGAYEGKKIAEVRLSSPKIQLLVDDGINWIPVTKGILLSTDLPSHETANVQLIIVAPVDTGNYWMEIGGQRFEISVTGRRARGGEYINPFSGNPLNTVQPTQQAPKTTLTPRIRPQSRLQTSSSSSSLSSTPSSNPNPQSSSLIRIRLSASASPTVRFAQRGTVGSFSLSAGTSVSLLSKGGECVALQNGERLTSASILRLSLIDSGALTIDGIAGKNRSYQGTIECRIVAGVLTLINELPLESYMQGLAEEPDSEPYEKQRAFAIAARTYALYYLSSDHRKFPGLPYDGSDDPALFQSYAGVEFTAGNPEWQRAVQSTAGSVLRYGGELIKPPYFSSDDGRTRSPSEAGWSNFPFAEIFSSKSDPWCKGLTLRGHGVGMSGCGAKGQALEGRSAEQILQYYYPGARI